MCKAIILIRNSKNMNKKNLRINLLSKKNKKIWMEMI